MNGKCGFFCDKWSIKNHRHHVGIELIRSFGGKLSGDYQP
jgi:hypothetical protein